MKISKVQINGFGNLADRNLEFSDGINVIHGNNEAGKSTLSYFIKSMFYGINKNKSGKQFSEFERFKPWNDVDFSGKIDYVLDDKKYSVFRDFNRNNSKVFDGEGNEITALFNKDKSRGVEIGFSHFGIDEDTFFNSLFISQGNVSVGDNGRKTVIQKLTNIIQNGNESISYDKAKQKIHKILLDDVGTDRTHNKPINTVTRAIEAYEKTRDELLYNRTKKESIDDTRKKLNKRLEEITTECDMAERVFEVKTRYANLISEREKEHEISLKILEKERIEKTKRQKKVKSDLLTITGVASLIIFIVLIFYKYYLLSAIPLISFGILAGIIVKVFSGEIKLSEVSDLDVIKENLRRKEKKELEGLSKEGVKDGLIGRKLLDIKNLINGLEKEKNDVILQLHKLDIEDDGVSKHVERLNDVEEQLSELYEKEESLRKLEYSLELAESILTDSYEELKKDIVPHIGESIKKKIAETTNGRYVDAIYNDNLGLMIQTGVGDIISIDKLSMGTIDQMYLGFRFAIAEKIGDIPVFLDEAFVYYDNERLENILSILEKGTHNTQIFIMTCSDREKNILDEKKIDYNYIEL